MDPTVPSSAGRVRPPRYFGDIVRFAIAPVVCLAIGFFTADFLLSGVYTWPRTSRAVALTVSVAVLSYEFVFKERTASVPGASTELGMKAVLYSCLVPYAVGFLALVGLTRLAS